MQQASSRKGRGSLAPNLFARLFPPKIKIEYKVDPCRGKDSACFSLFYTKMFVESLKEEVYDVIAKEVRLKAFYAIAVRIKNGDNFSLVHTLIASFGPCGNGCRRLMCLQDFEGE